MIDREKKVKLHGGAREGGGRGEIRRAGHKPTLPPLTFSNVDDLFLLFAYTDMSILLSWSVHGDYAN